MESDDDMPLNLSIKPTPNSPNCTPTTNRLGSSIWSPASMCERDTPSDIPSHIPMNRAQHQSKSINQISRNQIPISPPSAHSSDSEDDNHQHIFPSQIQQLHHPYATSHHNQHRHRQCLASAETSSSSGSSHSESHSIYSPSVVAAVAMTGPTPTDELIQRYQNHHHELHQILHANRTDMIAVNNNNNNNREFPAVKQIVRPDSSTTHIYQTSDIQQHMHHQHQQHQHTKREIGGGQQHTITGKHRQHRCFEVSYKYISIRNLYQM